MEILLMIIVGIIGFALDAATERKIPPTELEQLRNYLLKYCEQNPWAVVPHEQEFVKTNSFF